MVKFIWHKYKKAILITIAIVLFFLACHNVLSVIQQHIEDILNQLTTLVDMIGLWPVVLAVSVVGYCVNFFGIPTYFSIMIVTFLAQDWRIGFVYALAFEAICFSSQLFLSRFFIGNKITKKYGQTMMYQWINEHVDNLGYILFVVMRYMPAFAYEVQNYVLGITTMSWSKFVFYSGLVSIPANLILTHTAQNAEQLTTALLIGTFVFLVVFNLGLFFVIMIGAMLLDKNKSEEVRKVLIQGKDLIIDWWKNLKLEKEKYLLEQEKSKVDA